MKKTTLLQEAFEKGFKKGINQTKAKVIAKSAMLTLWALAEPVSFSLVTTGISIGSTVKTVKALNDLTVTTTTETNA